MRATVIMNIRDEKPKHFIAAIESYLVQNCDLVISTVEGDPCLKHLGDLKKVVLKDPPERSPVGAYLQLNNALSEIKNQWWCYASSNDVSYPNKIEQEINTCLEQNKKVCYSAYDTVDEIGRYLGVRESHKFNVQKLLRGCYINDCAMIHASLNKYLPFNLEHKNYGYWDFWLNVYENEGDVFAYNPIPTWSYTLSRNSMHIKRKSNPKLVQQFKLDEEKMLNKHRLRING